MSRKIFNSILLAVLSVLFISLTVITGVMYRHLTGEQLEQLRNEMNLTVQGVTLNGEEYLRDLDTVDFRVTWIVADGTILYDNAAPLEEMENHLGRQEIIDALEKGYGESERYSPTLSKKQLYVARKMPDGTVLRLSITQATVWNLFLRFLIPVVFIIAGAAALSFILAARLSKRIVEPLNRVDLDAPLENAGDKAYAEILPLLKKLDDQRKQIQMDREELEKTSLIRQEFTANASHELKTPLHVISGYAELLENGMVKNEDIPMFAGKILSEAKRMSKLTEDIIDLSSLDGGGPGMVPERTDLWRISRNAVESLESEAEEAGVTITLSGENAYVCGVPHVLYSIVYNLCDNAIKYSREGGEITVSTKNEGDHAVLSVCDNGIGIPAEDLDRIFERFYRVDKSHSKEVGGTGLGLSIVKHAARLHGASIDVKSELGHGTVFTLMFPKEQTSCFLR